MMSWAYVAVGVGSFLIGAIPFSWILGRAGGADIRRAGSGNPGATNLYRTLGPKYGVPGLLLDVIKGTGPVVAARLLFPGVAGIGVVAAAAAISGHIWTPFLGFKGGKGVATAAGAFLGLNPLILAVGAAAFLLVAAVSRYVSLGSICGVLVAAASAIVLPYLRGRAPDWMFVGFTAICAATIIFAHRSNLARLVAGTEGKWGSRRPPAKGECDATS